jgi:uncharacterized coiled-coil DUF342 family protein
MNNLTLELETTSPSSNRISEITTEFTKLSQELDAVRTKAEGMEPTFKGLVAEIEKMGQDSAINTQNSINNTIEKMRATQTDQLEKVIAAFGDLANIPQIQDRINSIKDAIQGISEKSDIPTVAQQIKDLVNNLKELDKVNIKSAGWIAALDQLDNTGKI